jgi:hypothetical protein
MVVFRGAEVLDTNQALNALNEGLLRDIPRHLRDVVLLDAYAASTATERNPGHISVAEAYRILRRHKTVSVCGGSRLPEDDIIYGTLNTLLAEELFKRDWSVVTGGGPGAVMAGLHKAIIKLRGNNPPDRCLCVGVASGLDDEQIHGACDLIIRKQNDIATRENIIIQLPQVVIFYPGNWGTGAEALRHAVESYCKGRGDFPYVKRLGILLSHHMGDLKGNQHYWGDLLRQFGDTSSGEGLGKAGTSPGLELIHTPPREALRNVSPETRKALLRIVAKEIIARMETFISENYSGRFEGSFGDGIVLGSESITRLAL